MLTMKCKNAILCFANLLPFFLFINELFNIDHLITMLYSYKYGLLLWCSMLLCSWAASCLGNSTNIGLQFLEKLERKILEKGISGNAQTIFWWNIHQYNREMSFHEKIISLAFDGYSISCITFSNLLQRMTTKEIQDNHLN